jgi:hypothetical protein
MAKTHQTHNTSPAVYEWHDAVRHVARIVGRLDWAADDLRQAYISGDLEFEDTSQSKPLTRDDFRELHSDKARWLRTPDGSYCTFTSFLFPISADVERLWPTELPRTRPEELTAAEWLVVGVVWKLWFEHGYRWPHLEVLRKKVCVHFGWEDKDLSLPTMRGALIWLHKNNYGVGQFYVGEPTVEAASAQEEPRVKAQPGNDLAVKPASASPQVDNDKRQPETTGLRWKAKSIILALYADRFEWDKTGVLHKMVMSKLDERFGKSSADRTSTIKRAIGELKRDPCQPPEVRRWLNSGQVGS